MSEDKTDPSRRRLLRSAGASLVAAAGLGAVLRPTSVTSATADPSTPQNMRDDGG